MTGENVSPYNWCLLEVEQISSHSHKTGSWYLLGVLLKISDEHRRLFLYGSIPPPPRIEHMHRHSKDFHSVTQFS